MIILLVIVFLFIVAVQDYLFRSISAVLIPVGIVIFSFHSYSINGFSITKDYFLINLIIISIQITALFLFFFIRNRGFINIINSHVGSGDIFFLLVIAFFFSPFNFLLFLSISLVLIIFITSLIRVTNICDCRSIPLAGHLASLILILIFLNLTRMDILFYDDHYISNTINNVMMNKF